MSNVNTEVDILEPYLISDLRNIVYDYYGYYINALEKQKQDKIKYGTADFTTGDVEGYAKDVQNQYNTIIQMKFR